MPSTLQVYKAIDLWTGDTVALKKIFVKSPDQGVPDNVLREYKGLQILSHENIIKLLDIFVEVRIAFWYCAEATSVSRDKPQ